MEYPEDEKLLELFQKRFKAAQDARKDFDDKCDLIDKHYEPWRSRWKEQMDRTAHVFHIIETMSANMIEPDPDLDLKPREPSDEQAAKAVSAAVQYGLERAGWAKKNMRLVRTGNRYGLSTVKILWDYDDRIDEREEEYEAPHPNVLARLMGRTVTQTQTIQELTVLKDDFDLVNVDRRDFWWQPRALDIDVAEWCMHRTYVPLPVLETREEDGIYRCVNMVKAGSTSDGQTLVESTEAEKDRRRVDEDGVEVIEMFDKVRNLHLVVANRSVIIRAGKLPYQHGELPFACYVPIPVEGRFEGVSPVEVLIPQQERTWQMETDRIRAVELALNPTLLVNKQLKGNTDFHIESGGRIFVSDPNDIQQLRIDANSALGFEEVQAQLGYMQQISGVSPYIAGADPSGYGIDNKTATGVNQLAGAAGRRIGFHIQQLQDAVARMGRQIVMLMQEFIDQERVVRIVGRRGAEWVVVSPDDIPQMFDISVRGSTEYLNKQGEQQKSMELVQTLAQFHGMPRPDGTQLDAGRAIDRYVETHDLDPAEFWTQQTEQTQMQEQAGGMQAMADAQAAMGDAQMAQPETQMMMQEAQQSPNDLNGDGVDDLQRKVFESMNFKDLPVDAQAALLEQRGLPSQGLMQQDALQQQVQMAKIQQMTAQASGQNAGVDNA